MSSTKLALTRETVRVLAAKTHLKVGAIGHLAPSKRWIGHSVVDCSYQSTAPVVTK